MKMQKPLLILWEIHYEQSQKKEVAAC